MTLLTVGKEIAQRSHIFPVLTQNSRPATTHCLRKGRKPNLIESGTYIETERFCTVSGIGRVFKILASNLLKLGRVSPTRCRIPGSFAQGEHGD